VTEGGGGPQGVAAGGPAPHHPVLLPEVLAALAPAPGRTILDGTFGAGGYSRALLSHDGTRVIALDRDPTAAANADAVAADHPGRFTFRAARFSTLDIVAADLGLPALDGVVLDVGVSSMQLDQAERGFSFRADGPLDMRMEQDGPSAADVVNGVDEETLAAILFHLGEERDSRRIARAVVADRVASPFTRTRQLAELVARVVRNAPKGIHPATRTFQALRIAVNDELGELLSALGAAERALGPGGVLAVVTFHSLEDRLVKRFLARASGRGAGGSRHLPQTSVAAPSFSLPGRQPVLPGDDEVARNPRARSAKLRVAVRTDASPLTPDPELRKLAGPGRLAMER
jgi:16S rRNA (cytosine1402-N4)-methyltransferase